ncbi:MAG: hypothetical protein LUC48_06425 [Clostridiales bacterium]|nr:hypothetical protein [Clostridiales bacterium]
MRRRFNFFGLNDLTHAPQEDKPPRTGAARYFQVLWENLGKLLLGNLLCCAGFLPAALGVSLGLVYENFWLALIGGAVGGAIAGPFWTAMVDLSLRCFANRVDEWFAGFRHTLSACWKPAALQGLAVGVLVAGLLTVGGFASDLMEGGTLPAPVVWVVLILDFFLAALAVTLLFPPLCYQRQPLAQRIRESLTLLTEAPLRTLAATLGLLLWCALLGSLFPVSVPLSAVLGVWPPALYVAQLQRPGLVEQYGPQEEPPEREVPEGKPGHYTMSQRTEIWWRRHWGVVLALVAVISLALGVIQTVTSFREPDVQVAFVHADSLPDNVLSALETSLGELVGDLNGDGEVVVQVNDYQVVFDGSATDSDVQTAGSTLLVTDVAGGESSLFIVEDAEGFLELYADQMDTARATTWGESPVLSGLDAGTYSTVEDIDADLTGQELLAEYTVLPATGADSDVLALLLGE